MSFVVKRYKLTAEGIDQFSQNMQGFLEEIGLSFRNCLRVRLSYEESLLRMRDKFGEETEVALTLGKKMGRPVVELSHEGDQFNPLSKREVSLEDWSGSLLTSVGLYPQYAYSKGKNILKLILPATRMNPGIKVLIGIAIGTVIGMLLVQILTGAGQERLINVVLEPMYDVWIRIISVLSGPVIFLMVITTVLNTGNIEEEGGSSRKVVARYFLFSLIVGVLAIMSSRIFSDKSLLTSHQLGIDPSMFLRYCFNLVPEDLFSPLIDANTPQLLLIAFVLGNGMVAIGSRVDGLVKLVRQINDVGLLMTDWIGRCVPYVIACLVCYEVVDKNTGILTDLWKPIGIALLVSTVILLFVLRMVSLRKGVGFILLLRKLWPSFISAIRSGGLDKGYGEMEDITIRQLGIEKHFAQMSLPHGIILYMPINVVGTLILTLHGAEEFSVPITVGWIIIAELMSVIMFVATPPVLGANILAYIMIFSLLGIPDVVLITAMIFEVLFGIFASAGNQAMLQMDLIMQADRIGLLDKDQLRSKKR